MPWKECSLMSRRYEFVQLAQSPQGNLRELCRRFQISPKTAYKWLARYRQEGPAGLADRSRRPLSSPRRSAPELEAAIVALHRRYPDWGARKLRQLLPERWPVPHPSTIDAILKRHGCHVRGTDASAEPARQRFEHAAPNVLWQMDFKGHFPLLDARQGRCHPLTLLDDHSRYALCLQACANERSDTVQSHLVAVFRRYGLPQRITADNGPPWGTPRRGGLSGLEVWLLRLGIRVSHSRPHHPQTQGKLERFHRTLKRELLSREAFTSFAQCQQRMDRWRTCYNQRRPHHALGQHPPLSRYRPSTRTYPEQLPPILYDEGDRVLKVRINGQITLQGRQVFVGEGLAGHPVAVRPTATDGLWDIVFLHRTIRQVDFRLPP